MSRTALVGCVIAIGGAARAGPAAGWQLGAEAVTDFPLDAGVRVAAEDPHRVRLSLALGWLPGPYVDAIDGALVGVGAYSSSEASLVRLALRRSAVARAHLGWRPWTAHGAYLDAGYTLFAFGGSASDAQLIAGVTGKMVPPDSGSAKGYELASTLHLLDGELGWEWRLDTGLTVRVAIGFAGTIAASTSARPAFTPRDPAGQRAFTDAAAAYLDHLYTSYVFTPTATFAMGWALR